MVPSSPLLVLQHLPLLLSLALLLAHPLQPLGLTLMGLVRALLVLLTLGILARTLTLKLVEPLVGADDLLVISIEQTELSAFALGSGRSPP